MKGTVVERSNKNPEIATGEIEIVPETLEVSIHFHATIMASINFV